MEKGERGRREVRSMGGKREVRLIEGKRIEHLEDDKGSENGGRSLKERGREERKKGEKQLVRRMEKGERGRRWR